MKIPRKPAIAFASFAAASALFLSACSSSTTDASSSTTTDSSTDSTTETVSSSTTNGEATYDDLDISDVDLSPSTDGATTITLADGASSSDGDGVTIDGDTITITAAGTYVLSGELSDGQVVVDVEDGDVYLVLDGASITMSGAPAIQVDNASNTIVYTEAGTTNTLADTGTYDDTDEETGGAALWSSDDLFLAGEGTLIVDAGRNDGITSKDTLVIASGTVEVTAVDDGIRGKDALVILDGDITVDAGTGHALKSDNEADDEDTSRFVGVVWIEGGTIDLTSGEDGIHAANQVTIDGGDVTVDAGDDGIHSDVYLRIGDAEIDITNSYEGLEAAMMYLDAGTVSIVSSDDGINGSDGSGQSDTTGTGGAPGGGSMPNGGGPGGGSASGTSTTTSGTTSTTSTTTTSGTTSVTYTTSTDDTSTASTTTTAMGGMDAAEEGVLVTISGGTYLINADGDGLDSNGSIEMTGGTVVISGPTNNGNGAIDYNGTFEITGGTIAASGASGMAQSPSSGEATLSISFNNTVASGTTLSVLDSDGNLVMSFTTEKTSSSLVLSSSELTSGETYTVVSGGTASGGDAYGPLMIGGTLTGGDTLGTLDAS
ncbi:carbohydrate-binding domain-containing protein [Demequina capsici]|uniref:Carbohydrate-binding domain-containing protein n=1 Tax=Demequina capsici TaxID=3075620 RepID=A0AA96JA72_9MICO|nr:carbohydrate-binding domain-containing protein [Demequina sp. OYTSA14]WNM24316.1 carbohydrate-binding domain-containing protein [Demequina sp. OYTSA14]